jgi:hypothetical protein
MESVVPITVFEPDYVEKYHSFLLTERIVSDALTSLLLVKAGREHHMINDTLQELRKVREELINSKEDMTPIGYVSYALMRILSEEKLEEMIRNLDQLIRILEGSESPDDNNIKYLVEYFMDITLQLGENFKKERENALGILRYYGDYQK